MEFLPTSYHQDPRLIRPFEDLEFSRRRDDEDTCVSSVTGFPAELYPESGMMYPSIDSLPDVPDHHHAMPPPNTARSPLSSPPSVKSSPSVQPRPPPPPTSTSTLMYPSLASIVEIPDALPSAVQKPGAEDRAPEVAVLPNRRVPQPPQDADYMRRTELAILKAAQNSPKRSTPASPAILPPHLPLPLQDASAGSATNPASTLDDSQGDDYLRRTEAEILKAAAGGKPHFLLRSKQSSMDASEVSSQEDDDHKMAASLHSKQQEEEDYKMAASLQQQEEGIVVSNKNPSQQDSSMNSNHSKNLQTGTDPTTNSGSDEDDEENTGHSSEPSDDNHGVIITTSQDNEHVAEVAVVTVAPQHDDVKKDDPNVCGKSYSKKTILTATVLSIVTVLGIVILLGAVCGSGHCGSSDTLASTTSAAPPTERFRAVQTQLVATFGASYFSQDDEYPRQQALDWIVNDDPLQLPHDHVSLLQRFILAVFYFSTSRHTEWLACNAADADQGDYCYYARGLEHAEQFGIRWLAGYHECQWAGIRCAGVLQVEEIRLSANQINGRIPSELALLSGLKVLSLWHNELSGSLPVELTTGPVSLHTLQLQENNLVGTLPSALFANLHNLAHVNLGANAFTGVIPTEVGLLAAASSLDLRSNQFTGTLPIELFRLSQLNELHLSGNKITGTIPSKIRNLVRLGHLDLSATLLSGFLPSEIGLLQSIQSLNLGNTKLEGSLPEELFTGDKSLALLFLNDCQYSGTISSQVGLLTNLRALDLSNNEFDGSIPKEIANLKKLDTLKLNGNPSLTGAVPSEICTYPTFQIPTATLVADCLTPQGGNPNVECACCSLCCSPSSGVCPEGLIR